MDAVTLVTTVVSCVTLANYFFYKLYTLRLNQIERRIERLDNLLYQLDKNINRLGERVARLEAIVNSLKLKNK